ncbi:hypothetical protein CSOJ01_09922 [Colletotrichum sojae]|uniref:Uncharacterized protein n=1 Tax=Colletotrichum sojae TaxID=2175907 RepID=A0A8H6MQR2_9PEZI|nr:hypothetical protein CSOJ01_09922 [Colletotrichum sojae]
MTEGKSPAKAAHPELCCKSRSYSGASRAGMRQGPRVTYENLAPAQRGLKGSSEERVLVSSLTTSTRAVVDHDPRLTSKDEGEVRQVPPYPVPSYELNAPGSSQLRLHRIDQDRSQTKATDPEVVEHLVGRTAASTVEMPHALRMNKDTRGRARTQRKAHRVGHTPEGPGRLQPVVPISVSKLQAFELKMRKPPSKTSV